MPNDQSLKSWFDSSSTVVEEKKTIEQEDKVSVPAPNVEITPVQPTYPTIDPLDVPVGVTLRSTDDDLLREYIVWAWVIARNNGVPKPTQKAIGRLVEGNEIEAYRPRSGLCRTFTQTMDAVIHLIAGAGYKMSDLLAAQEEMRKEEPSSPVVAPLQTIVEVIPDSVETPEVTVPDPAPALTIGSRVKVISPRHGEQLVGQVGEVTAATPVGCVVVLGDLSRWFCNDEVETEPNSIEPIKPLVETGTTETIQVGDWVELLENNQNYEVIAKKGDNLKLVSSNETKFASEKQVKFLFSKPADFTPF